AVMGKHFFFFFFFFSSRRRHTRCLSDWSSDVCSSDLHMAVADFQHVRIIPVPWTSKFLQTILSKPNQRHAFVAVADVTRGPPQIAGLRSPAPRCFHAPVANAEHDGAAGLRQRITEFRVLHRGVETLR